MIDYLEIIRARNADSNRPCDDGLRRIREIVNALREYAAVVRDGETP